MLVLRAGQWDGHVRGLASVEGIGQQTITKLEDQMLEWLAKNQKVEADESSEWEDVANTDAEYSPADEGVEYVDIRFTDPRG